MADSLRKLAKQALGMMDKEAAKVLEANAKAWDERAKEAREDAAEN